MDPVTTADESTDMESTDDIEAARRRIRDHGETVWREQRARALRRLEANRDLSQHERRVISRLAEQLAREILAQPEKALRKAANDETDDETARVALRLFGEP